MNEVLEVLQTVFEVSWESEQDMWEAIADALGCPVDRAKFLGGVLAFAPPFDESGNYLGLPCEGSCKFCGSAQYARGMCLKHYRSHMRAGEFGVYQWHRICKDGTVGYHSPPEEDAYGVPRCTKCGKSMLEVDPDLRNRDIRAQQMWRARRGST